MIGLGTDVVDLDRFRLAVTRSPGLVDRLFTSGERDIAAARRDPVPALATTRDEVHDITGSAVRYVTALRRLV